MAPYTLIKVYNVSEEHTVSIFRVKGYSHTSNKPEAFISSARHKIVSTVPSQ
jgi:hypothetical protein